MGIGQKGNFTKAIRLSENSEIKGISDQTTNHQDVEIIILLLIVQPIQTQISFFICMLVVSLSLVSGRVQEDMDVD